MSGDHDQVSGQVSGDTVRAAPLKWRVMKPTPCAQRQHPLKYDMYTEESINEFYKNLGAAGILVSMGTFCDMLRDGAIHMDQAATMISIACQSIMIGKNGKAGFFASGLSDALDAIGQLIADRGETVEPRPYVSVLLLILPDGHDPSEYEAYLELRRRFVLLIVGMLLQRREMDEKLPCTHESQKKVIAYETASITLAYLKYNTSESLRYIPHGFLGVGSHPQSEDASTFSSQKFYTSHKNRTEDDGDIKVRYDLAWKTAGGTVDEKGVLRVAKGTLRVQPLDEIRMSLDKREPQHWPKEEEFMTINGLSYNILTILEHAHFRAYKSYQDSVSFNVTREHFTTWLAYWLHILIVACASYADPKLSKISFGTSLLRCTHCAGWMWRDKISAMYGKDMKTYGTSSNYSDICSFHVVERHGPGVLQKRVETRGIEEWLVQQGKKHLHWSNDDVDDEETTKDLITSKLSDMDLFHSEPSIAYALSEGKMLTFMAMGVGSSLLCNHPILFLDGLGQERFVAGLEHFLYLEADVYRHRLIFPHLQPMTYTQSSRKVAMDNFDQTIYNFQDRRKIGFFANNNVSRVIVLETQVTKTNSWGNAGNVNGWMVCFTIRLPAPLRPVLCVWSLHHGKATAQGKMLHSGRVAADGALLSRLYHACGYMGVDNPEMFALLARWRKSTDTKGPEEWDPHARTHLQPYKGSDSHKTVGSKNLLLTRGDLHFLKLGPEPSSALARVEGSMPTFADWDPD